MKKTIVLYNPDAVFFDMPLALISIGTQVCDRYKVVIIDARIEKNPKAVLEAHIDDTFLVGVTSLTGAPLKDAIAFSELVRSIDQSIPIIWGGWHTSLFPMQVLEDVPSVDIAVQGQGEDIFKQIVQVFEGNGELAKIDGITYRTPSGEIVKNAGSGLVDMNSMPRLNYNLVDVEKYFEAKGQRQFDFITSIGCFFRCTFCADPFVFNRKYNGLLPERVVEDLNYYHDKYQFTDVNFQDETFFTYPKRIVEMAQRLTEAGSKFTWAATMRADQGSRMSLQDFQDCKKSGLRRLLIGVESGSQEMMDWLKKDIKVEQVIECAERCKELEIAVIFPFIVGFPNETDASIEESKRMIRRLSFMSAKFETPIFYFKPYPGTKITDEVVARGEYTLPTTIQEWAQFDYIGSKGPWVSDEKYAFFERFKFYLKVVRKRNSLIFKPIAFVAKKRLQSMNFGLPIEKIVGEKVFSKKELS